MNALVHTPRAPLEPGTLTEAITFARELAKSSMIPRDFQGKAENILVAMQWGREIGLGTLQALQNIAVINGRPAVWGDAMLALVKASPLCEYVEETVEGDGDASKAICRTKRKGARKEEMRSFDVADARKAGLWDKVGPWKQYPKRMLQMRARGFLLRDVYPDVLRGVISAEEARDMPTEAFSGTTIDAQPEPSSRREQINAAVPMTEVKRITLREWLEDFETRCHSAQTEDEANEILKEERVLRLDDPALKISDNARQRGLAARQAMIDRIWREPVEEDEAVSVPA